MEPPFGVGFIRGDNRSMVNKPLHRFAVCAAWAAGLLAAAGPQPVAAAEPAFIIDLPAGGSLPGEFVAAPAEAGPRETLRWRAPQFAAPLEFRLDGIIGIRATAPPAPVARPEGFSCRLRDGDVIDGELEEIDATHVVLELPGGEPVRIDRAMVTGLGRGGEGPAAGYVGPGGLAGWRQMPNASWRDEAGRIASDVPNAVVARDVGGWARARYDMILSWRRQPQLTLSVAAADGNRPDPFRFEMLSIGEARPVAMLVRQEKGSAKLEPVPLPEGEPDRLRLTLFVDRKVGRLAAAVEGADALADITLPPDGGRGPAPRFRLQVMSGDVCLERLRVMEWTAAEPRAGSPDATQVVLRDGSVLEGDLVSLAADGKVVVRAAGGEQTRELDEIESIEFAASAEADDPAAARAASVRVVSRSGGALTGDIVAVADDGLEVARAGLDRSVRVPFVDLHALVSLKPAAPPALPGRAGTLKTGDAVVPGCLVDAAAWGGGLAWQPRGSLVASPLAGDPAEVSAVVEYVAPPAADAPTAGEVEVGGIGGSVNQDGDGLFVISMLAEDGAAARDGRIEPGDRIVAVRPVKDGPFVPAARLDLPTMMNLLRGRVGTPVSVRIVKPAAEDPEPQQIDLERGLIVVGNRELLDEALAEHAKYQAEQALAVGQQRGFPSLLVLRSGDAVPARVERIGAEGVRLRSPVTASSGAEAVTVANDLVRAIEFDLSVATSQITRDRFERLTTLPRAQRDDPPTHLLRLRTQDYLRGRLESLDADQVVFSVLGQRKTLPRAAVARIIWLHPDEIDYAAGGGAALKPSEEREGEEVPAAAVKGLLVQGVSPRGRTTVVADRLEGAALVGASPAFGPSRIDTKQIDKLLLGRAVGAGDEALPFAQWRLRLAPLPRALREKD
jgi:hypothetical protein